MSDEIEVKDNPLYRKQAKLAVLGLQIESLSQQYNQLKAEVIKEMNESQKSV